MPKSKKFYYLFQHLDIDGDKNPDGFLITKYKIDNNNNRIFLKSKYVTNVLFNKFINNLKKKVEKKTGGAKDNNAKQIAILMDEINKLKAEKKVAEEKEKEKELLKLKEEKEKELLKLKEENEQLKVMNRNEIDALLNKHNQQQQQPPPIVVEQETFLGNLGRGVGLGFGVSAGHAFFDGVGSLLSGDGGE